MKKSIAIDMDQVLADFYSKLCATYNENFGTNFTKEEFLLTTQRDLPTEDGKKLFALLNEPDYFRDLAVLDSDAIEVIKELQEHYEIYIATAAMDVPGSFTAKYEWLREHLPFLKTQNIVFCGNKAVIHTDYLIDDSSRQLEAFKGTGVLYSMPYNAAVEGYVRVQNWREIKEYFLEQLKA
ncbi:5'-3'-deoxyribonucleotidase [Lysinibacillus sp. 2017]|uniref:5' nucleotidase, NT5C type n=1 Tax=unclassified Lysinibacillus TaxID=2636778 RepID=UPI000D527DD5|nr:MULTISPECIES: 5'-3'-deoxyribonucleotidase [unclassified Lysinibacillus]AWE08091.1 5'-3'-deoxyribonucleotidase [Lysinibacillus sp. 2017]TGN36405.1 5'-3'-deoxyribonucleotidase [Lysinibacillus sp. S2017]